jgi:hypothetical protein
MKKTLRDASLGAATIGLLLYAAMTAAKSMAGVLQPEEHVAVSCPASADACPPAVVVARGD